MKLTGTGQNFWAKQASYEDFILKGPHKTLNFYLKQYNSKQVKYFQAET